MIYVAHQYVLLERKLYRYNTKGESQRPWSRTQYPPRSARGSPQCRLSDDAKSPRVAGKRHIARVPPTNGQPQRLNWPAEKAGQWQESEKIHQSNLFSPGVGGFWLFSQREPANAASSSRQDKPDGIELKTQENGKSDERDSHVGTSLRVFCAYQSSSVLVV